MSIIWNYSDTAVTSSVGAVQPASLNFSADWAKKSSDDKELVLINTTSPLDRIETLRFARTKVSNVYSGAGIEAAYYSAVRSGVSVLIQDTTIFTDIDASGVRTDYPVSAHLVLKVPLSDLVTETVLTTVLSRLIGGCYEQEGSTAGPRLNRLIRGALLPIDLT